MPGLVQRSMFFCCLLLLAALSLARAAPLSLRFEHLGVEQGLSQESVTTVLQDRHGYMWIGTQAGLNRYDGYRMTVFKNDPANPRTVLDNYIQALYEDEAGQLWIGSKGGLDRYDAASQSFVHIMGAGRIARLAGNLSVTHIISDGKQGLWLSTSDGLQHFDIASGKVQTLRHDDAIADSIADDRVSALARDKYGNLWVGTARGVEMMAADTTQFRHPAGRLDATPSNQIQTLSIGVDNVLWAGTMTGLQAWCLTGAGADRMALSAADSLTDLRITALLHDREGTLWVTTYTDGMRRRDAITGHFYTYQRNSQDRHGISDAQLSALYQDRTGTLWVGNWYAGLDSVDLASGGFERYTEYPGVLPHISNNKVRAIAGAGEDQLWLGTSDGLTRLDVASGRTEVWRHDEHASASLPGNQVMALDTDHAGRLWVGTTTGLARRDPRSGAWTTVALDADPASAYIQRILVDRAGVIWVASRAGLHRIDPRSGAVLTYRHDPAQAGSLGGRIFTMLEDSQGVMWLGLETGLDRYDPDTGAFQHYRADPRDADSLCHRRVHYLYEDSKSRLWIGTAAGLCMARTGRDGKLHFRFYGANDGSAPDPIGAILGDDTGHLWISTTAGLSMFDPGTGVFKHYTSRDGLIDSSYFIGSAYKSPDRRLYFGGLAGMTAFRSMDIHDNPYAPMVAITDFTIFNQSVLGARPRTDVLAQGPLYDARSLALTYRDAVFAFEFAGAHNADPQRNRYAYQLEGFDPHWVSTDAGRRFATYTNLDPGRYVFRVRAANKDGIWSDDSVAVELTIAPPFWGTWWFRVLAVSVVVGGAGLLVRLRIQMLVGQKQALELEVGSRTRELVLQKESIERQKQEALRQKENVEAAHRNISQLSDIGRRITANLDSEAIMSMLYQQVHELMDASVFGIGLYRPELELIEYPFAMEQDTRYMPYTRSMHEPSQLAVWCITHGREVFINDLEQEYRRYIDKLDFVSGPGEMGLLEDGSSPGKPCSLIYVPITFGGQVRGVITVHSYRRNAYQRVDLDMLNTLAAYVAVAFANADSYRQLLDTQQQLVEREKLAALGSLVAGVAHELNTPIGNSLVIASTLEDKTAEIEARNSANAVRRSDLSGFIGAAREASVLLMRSLRNAAELVNSFKQVSVDQASAKRRPFNLHQASHEIVTTIMNQIRKAGHRVELDIPEDIELDSFPGPYGQVIINLINNALLHAFDGGGSGLIRMWAVRLGPERVRIVFQDDGKGIPIEHLARIFDPFFTTKLGQGGNGLGLSITYNIVTSLLDGSIKVESVVGVGTSFTIDLPLKASLTGD